MKNRSDIQGDCKGAGFDRPLPDRQLLPAAQVLRIKDELRGKCRAPIELDRVIEEKAVNRFLIQLFADLRRFCSEVCVDRMLQRFGQIDCPIDRVACIFDCPLLTGIGVVCVHAGRENRRSINDFLGRPRLKRTGRCRRIPEIGFLVEFLHFFAQVVELEFQVLTGALGKNAHRAAVDIDQDAAPAEAIQQLVSPPLPARMDRRL